LASCGLFAVWRSTLHWSPVLAPTLYDIYLKVQISQILPDGEILSSEGINSVLWRVSPCCDNQESRWLMFTVIVVATKSMLFLSLPYILHSQTVNRQKV